MTWQIKVRCNHCMTVFIEDADTQITECLFCGKDDALMSPFEPSPMDEPWEGRRS